MTFSSIPFIFQFLPATLITYYIVPRKLKNLILLLASLVFYAWGGIRYLPAMILLIIVNYLAALFINHFSDRPTQKKLLLISAVIISLGILFFFRYFDFTLHRISVIFSLGVLPSKLPLPFGISFYTLQLLSYTIDVYRGRCDVQKNLIFLSTYAVMFPQLIAGPIVRYTDISDELQNRTITADKLEAGMEDFIIGLTRKVFIADNIGQLWAEVSDVGVYSVSTPLAWFGILAFALQIYFDFSGYSQMAIGLARMMGFTLPQNFENPYTARSVTEFWRRWHITLVAWFREYLYFPLGGSRRGNARTIMNLFILWSLIGLWHGATWNYVLWGLSFFLLLTIEKTGFISFLNKHAIFSHIYMILTLLVSWTFFATSDLPSSLEFIKRMFFPTSLIYGSSTVGVAYYLRNYAIIASIGCLFSTSLPTKIYGKIRQKRGIKLTILSFLFLLSIAYIIDSNNNPFLYFRF